MRSLSALLLLLALAAPAQAAAPFEGTIQYRITLDNGTVDLTHRSRGSQMRADLALPGLPGPVQLQMDLQQDRLFAVIPATKVYMEVGASTVLTRLLPDPQSRAQALIGPEARPTGTSDTVAGVPCDNYRFDHDGRQLEVCLATGMGSLLGIGAKGPLDRLGLDVSKWPEPLRQGMVPLRVRIAWEGGWPTVMEATSIDRTPPSPSLFVLPEGLRKVELPALPG